MTSAELPLPEGFPKFKEPTSTKICPTTGKGKAVCKCPTCIGRRNQRSGRTRQRHGRRHIEKLTGTQAAKYLATVGNEENWHGLPVRCEVKSGAQVDPIATRYRAAQAQSEAKRPFGDTRPFLFLAMPSGWGENGLVVMELDRLRDILDALS